MAEARQQVAGNQDVPLQQGEAPDFPLKVAETGYSILGTTTDDGDAAGTIFVDFDRNEDDDYWNGYAVLILTGACAGQLRKIENWDWAFAEYTVAPAFTAQILAGVNYRLIPVSLSAVAGSEGVLLLQKPVTRELIVEDTGLHTNPEKWMHDHHWDNGAQLVLNAAAAVNLGAAIAAGAKRRIRSITVRNTALANTVITVSQVAPAQNSVSFDVPSQTTRTWSEEDGVEFLAAVQVQISSSAAAVGSETYIHASGVEA